MNWKSKSLFRIVLASAIGLSAISSVYAQENKERRNISPEQGQIYVISAKAGGVSYASGAVRVERMATQKRYVLAKGDEISDGDVVSVGETGNAEILLNPGSFLRLAENTDIQFTDTNLESLLLKIKNGSALIEASAVGEQGADIKIVTPQSTVSLQKSGIYRLNVSANATEVFVWKGAAIVGNEFVKAGRKAVLQKGLTAVVAKFDKDESRDAFDIWSKDRSKELAKINSKIKNRDLTQAFSGYSNLYGFNRFGGFWAFNRLTGTYCFVPYGYGYFSSPYGYGYNSGIYWYYSGNNTPVVTTTRPSKPVDMPIYNPPTEVRIAVPTTILTPTKTPGAGKPGN
jgi:hypothetical protein